MNVLIVTDTFAPDINGVARTLETLARGLAGRGHEVDVVTTTLGARAGNLAQGVRVESVRSLRVPGYREVRAGLAGAGHLRSVMERCRTDVVYVAVETWMGWGAVRAARRLGVPVVSGFHTNFHSYADHYRVPFLKKAATRFLRWFHQRTARTLAPSRGTAEHLRELGVEHVGVLGRGVDTVLFDPARRDGALRREWGALDGAPVVAFVGRMAAEKNLPLAVRAMSRVMRSHPGARGLFVGDGPKARSLRESHPGFIHAGARTGADLARHYASADVFLFTSLTETYGNVLPEAMASGLVAVGYDYAAARELLDHGRNGFAAPPRDEDAFLKAVDLAAARWDEAALRRAARETAEKLSWSAIIAQFERELTDAGRSSILPGALQPAGLPVSP